LAAHPGWSATNLQSHSRLASFFNHILAQPAKIGALPTLYAATVPGLKSGDYIGPDGWKEMRGYPRKVSCSPQARDEHMAARLWQVSQELTGVTCFAG